MMISRNATERWVSGQADRESIKHGCGGREVPGNAAEDAAGDRPWPASSHQTPVVVSSSTFTYRNMQAIFL